MPFDRLEDVPADLNGMYVVFGQVVSYAGDHGMHLCSPQLFSGHRIPCSGFHQRGAADENSSLVTDDDGLVTHSRNVCATSSTRPHHHSDLRDLFCR